MAKTKVLVKVHPEGKYVVDIGKDVDVTKLDVGARVALKNDSYALHTVLPSLVDPLVSLMKVEKVPDSTFDMIGGLDQQVKEIKEVVELPIKHPELFESLGIAQPKGVILYGPRARARRFWRARWRTTRTVASSASPGRSSCRSTSARARGWCASCSRWRATRRRFCSWTRWTPSAAHAVRGATRRCSARCWSSRCQLDGLEASNQIKVIMATNRLDILDPALPRPGRIDRKIEFPNPTEDSRVDILKIHSRKMNLVRGIDRKKIASKMGGASGAESKAVCTEAGMFALRERRVHVTQEDFEMAVAKVMQKDSEKNVSVAKLFTCRDKRFSSNQKRFLKNVVILLAGDTALANTTAGNVGVDGTLSVSAEGDAAAKSLPTEQKGLGSLICHNAPTYASQPAARLSLAAACGSAAL